MSFSRHLSVLCGHSFFHPSHNGQWPPTSKDFYTRSYPLHYFLILILKKEPVFPFSMLSAKQGNYWYHFYNVFGMTRSLSGDWTRDLPQSKPALYTTRLSRRWYHCNDFTFKFVSEMNINNGCMVEDYRCDRCNFLQCHFTSIVTVSVSSFIKDYRNPKKC